MFNAFLREPGPFSSPAYSSAANSFFDRYNQVISQRGSNIAGDWGNASERNPFYGELVAAPENINPTDSLPTYEEIEMQDLSGVDNDADLAEEAGDIAEGAEVTSEIASGPVALAVMLGQATGNAISSGITSAETNSASSTYQSNLSRPGFGAVQQSEAVASYQRSTIASSGALMGGLSMVAGPLGALIGYALSPNLSATGNVNVNTAYSSGGMMNPQNDVTVNSGLYSTDGSTNISS